ncbi:hypothetical protein C0581_01400 [Candidatus Parcubacteria bacterium]|nr:MAG: hypothetical protein C0581_01400 [Candidatus Parcubacteria bacterium]
MEFWHFLVIGYVVSMSFGQYIGKVFVHKIHPYQILFYQYIASIITTTIYIKLLKPDVGFFDIPIWFLGIGFLFAIAVTSTYHAKKQSLSKTSVMTKVANFITIILAVIFLQEYELISFSSFDGIQRLLGLLLIIVTVFLFYQKKTHRGSEETFDHSVWIKWITVHIFVMGFAKFIVKYAVTEYDPLSVLRLQYIGSLFAISLLCVFSRKTIFIGWKKMVGTLVIGLFISTAMSSLYVALSQSSATQVLSVVTVGMIMVLTLMGVFFFKEKITKRMIVPFVLGIISIYFLK